jgi:hypothetical protein
MPREQRDAERVFQILQQLRRRRLRDVQQLCGTVDVAFVVERNEQQQLARLEPGAHEPLAGERHGAGLEVTIPNRIWFDRENLLVRYPAAA